MKKTKTGKIFLDRNGEIFSFIIDFLRNDLKITTMIDEFKKGQFYFELEYWKLIDTYNPTVYNLIHIFQSVPIFCSPTVIDTWKKYGPFKFEELWKTNVLNFDKNFEMKKKFTETYNT